MKIITLSHFQIVQIIASVALVFNSTVVQAQEPIVPPIVQPKGVISNSISKPEFPGGEAACLEWLLDSIHYPSEALDEMAEGNVCAKFTVEADGSVGDISFSGMPNEVLKQEVSRVVALMPKWQPAMKDNQPVAYRCFIPVFFHCSNLVFDPTRPFSWISIGDIICLGLSYPKQTDGVRASGFTIPRVEGDDDIIYEVFEASPEYEGGYKALEKYLNKSARLPKKYRKWGQSVDVRVEFIVDKDGVVQNVFIDKDNIVYNIESLDNWMGLPPFDFDTATDDERMQRLQEVESRTEELSETVSGLVQSLVKNMKRWKPARQGNKSFCVKLSLTVHVSRM